MKITTAKLASILLGTEETMTSTKIDCLMKKRQNKTASNNYYNVTRIMRALGLTDVLDVFRPEGGGGYAAARWIDEGRLPNGKKDKRHGLVSPASKMSYFNALSSISNPKKSPVIHDEISKESREYFLQRAIDLSKRVKEIQMENKLSDRELSSIAPWGEIQKKYRENRDALDAQERLLADMYLCCCEIPEGCPRRLDYGEVYIYKQTPRSPRGDMNYIVVSAKDKKVTLVLRNFKTYRHYGEYRCVLPAGLSAEIALSVKDDPREWLFYKLRGSSSRKKVPLSANTFGVRLSSTMEKLTGKSIGVSNLRKSFITWLHNCNDKSEKELSEFAHAMGHSTDMARLYRKINIDESKLSGGGRCGGGGVE